MVVDRLSIEDIPAPDSARRLLRLPADSRVIARRRRYLINDEPVQLATAYIPADLAAGTPITEADTALVACTLDWLTSATRPSASSKNCTHECPRTTKATHYTSRQASQ